jgi:hypothetical protein
MMATMSSDPLQVIDQLDSQQLRDALARLERQRSALVVLLRAAVARERGNRRPVQREVRRGR